MSDVQAGNSGNKCYKPPCFQVMESTTNVEYEEFIFRWNIKVPTPCNKLSLNKTFESQLFYGGERSQHSWKVRWYRYGDGDYRVQLINVVIGKDGYYQGEYIRVHPRMSLKKTDEKELLKIKPEHEKVPLQIVAKGGTCLEMPIRCADLWNEKNGYIIDNVFTVCCRIFISCMSNQESVSKLLSVSSCESYSCFNDDNISRSIADVTKGALCALNFTDVELVTDTKSFPAHKVVLAAHSPVFSAMFQTDMKEMKDNSVEIKDFGAQTVEAMLEFIYTGKILKLHVAASYSKGADLLQIADKYELLELKSQCEIFLCLKVTVQRAIEMLELATLYSCNVLKSAVLQYIMSNKKKVYETDAFKKLADPLILKELLMFN